MKNAGQFEPGLSITSLPSGSDNAIKLSGTFPLYNSTLVFNTGSRGTNVATLVKINQLNPDSAEPDTYATASVTRGGTDIEFKETLQPFVSASRLSTTNQVKEFYYGSLSDSVSAGYGEWSKFGDFYIISQSFEPTDLETPFTKIQ